MTEPVIAAVAQMTSTDDVHRNLDTARRLVRRAVARGASLVLLPENAAFMGPEAERMRVAERFEPDRAPDGPIGECVRELSRETGAWVIYGGLPEQNPDGKRTSNLSIAVAPDGTIAARYRKIHLFDVALADGTVHTESSSVAPGAEVVVVDTALGRTGLAICYDLRFPELFRRQVDLGATVLTVPAAFTVTTGRDHWHVLLRARAIESQCYVLAAAQWGAHGHNRTTYGHALIADPWGTVLCECPDGESVALAEIDPARTERIRASLPSLKHRVLT